MSATGVYRFKRSQLEINLKEISDTLNFESNTFQLSYSIKANYNDQLIDVLNKRGSHFDCASQYELFHLLQLEIPKNKIRISTPYISDYFFRQILDHGLFFYADSIDQIIQLQSIADKRALFEIGLRFCMPGHPSRFGIEPTRDNFRLIKDTIGSTDCISITGMSMHYSEADRSASKFSERVEAFLEAYNVAKEYFEISILNFGGGFAGKMSERLSRDFDYKIPTWNDYASAIKGGLERHAINGKQIYIEPGMALAADAFDYMAEVILIKRNFKETIAVLNTSTLFLKPTGHKRPLDFEIINEGETSYKATDFTLVGKSCMEMDVLGSHYGQLEVGDKVLFKNVGAYTMSYRDSFIFKTPEVLAAD
ncbi:MAG: hypothetical protein WBA16_08070 [Nonlabens sp.]